MFFFFFFLTFTVVEEETQESSMGSAGKDQIRCDLLYDDHRPQSSVFMV